MKRIRIICKHSTFKQIIYKANSISNSNENYLTLTNDNNNTNEYNNKSLQ